MVSLSAAIFLVLMLSVSIGEGRENCPTSTPTWYEWTWHEWGKLENSGKGCGQEGIQTRRRTRMPTEADEGDGMIGATGEGRENCPKSMPPSWYEWTWHEWTWARFDDCGNSYGHDTIQIRRRTRMSAEASEGRGRDGLLHGETSTNTSTSGTPATSMDRMSSGKSPRRSNSKLRRVLLTYKTSRN